jgi:hypothetical protein
LRRAMGERLQARQRRLFSLEMHVAKLEKLYESVLS